ncbi:MAG: hypothetical protein C0505_11200 [Leptothrix sp. (in: Bacteria)]|nr:hypothetical protein [Leptothrix sp. (in: b-proteobacteria)]
MKRFAPTTCALALAAAFPAAAQSNEDLLKELRALRDRVQQLEQKLQAAPAAAAPAPGQWGMTPEQARELNRISVKAESMQDSFAGQGYKGLKIGGYIEPVFIWNKNQDRAGFQFLNEDGYYYDTSYMGAAVLDLSKETESGTLWRLVLSPNRGVGAFTGASIVQEASVSVPLGDLQTRLIAGQIPDWSGYEYQQPALNPFITHNLLYDFTLPLAYTGAGMSITRGKWWMRAVVGNLNTTKREAGEKSPVLAYRVDYSKGEFDGWGFAGVHGKTPNYNLCRDASCSTFTGTNTNLFEVDGYYFRGDWTLQGQLAFGNQKQAAIQPGANGEFRDSSWTGVSGLVGYSITPRLQVLLRADYIKNNKNGGGLFGYTGYWDAFGVDGPYGDYRNGIGPDPTLGCEDVTIEACSNGANRSALSLGLKYRLDENTTLKAEWRRDGASLPVFYDVKGGGWRKTNQLLGASMVVAW